MLERLGPCLCALTCTWQQAVTTPTSRPYASDGAAAEAKPLQPALEFNVTVTRVRDDLDAPH